MSIGPDWICWLSGGLLAVAGAVLLGWALFRDPARGRRRCPKCWYDMAGVPGLTCPECGRTQPGEKSLSRSRRRWSWVVPGAALFIVGLGVAAVPGYRQSGWVGVVPSSALVLIAPPDFGRGASWPSRRWSPAAGVSILEQLRDETRARLWAGKLAVWQERLLLRRFAEDCASSLRITVSAPARWPEGVVIPVAGGPAIGFGNFPRADVSVRCREPQTDWIDVRAIGHVMVPSPAARVDALEFEVRAKTPTCEAVAGLRFLVVVSGTTDTFLERVGAGGVGDQVQGILGPRLERKRDGQVELVFADDAHDQQPPLEFQVSFVFQVVLGDRILGSGRGEAPWAQRRAQPWGTTDVTWEEGGLAAAVESNGQAEIIVTGDPEAAGRSYMRAPFDGRRAACWTGQFRMPLVLEQAR